MNCCQKLFEIVKFESSSICELYKLLNGKRYRFKLLLKSLFFDIGILLVLLELAQ